MLIANVSAGRPTALRGQAAIGLALAGAIIVAWMLVHLGSLFLLPFKPTWWAAVPIVVALQCWLSVGLFIVSHDAMHGSLAPFRPGLNRAVGRVALMLYGGIWYDSLVARHFAHHRAPGTHDDPDFFEDGTRTALPWFIAFFSEYLSAGQLLRQSAVAAFYVFVCHVAIDRLLLFWAAPALLSAVQLFYFGTYLPHRRENKPFVDGHRTRSNEFPYWLSLATCFHFGYHHEHHAEPWLPWWRLPSRRVARATSPIEG